MSRKPISETSEWTFELIEKYHTEIARVAAEFGLDTYPVQMEIITAEQMLDAYSGLSYGPYSIFHAAREDGKSLVYVASTVEPGSFDIERMDETAYPGVSLFGVVPGPLDAPATFDLVLAVGRGLADKLKGQLQDEQGSSLTAQRVLSLREELVHFEHLAARQRVR